MRAKQQKMRIYLDLQSYRRKHGKYPISLQKMYGGRQITDPWQRSWVYRRKKDGSYILFSKGPDGREGTRDDI